MKNETPRAADGETLCEWCGGTVRQPGVGRRRAYCKQGCREMAYRARKTTNQINTAVNVALALERRRNLPGSPKDSPDGAISSTDNS